MLLPFFPGAYVALAVRPLHGALATSAIAIEFTFVFSAISVRQHPMTLHQAVDEASFICSLVRPYECALPFYFTIGKFSFVKTIIASVLFSGSVLVAVLILSFVSCAICLDFDAGAVWLVIEPRALVEGAVCLSVCALSMRFAVEPLSLVNITFCVDHLAVSTHLAILKFAFILRPIRPKLDTFAIYRVSDPLPSIHASIRQLDSLLQQSFLTPMCRRCLFRKHVL